MIVAKYKFDKSIYENLIPVFNDEYNGYTISDGIDSENENYIIRTIECDILPTEMRFSTDTEYVEKALISVDYINTGNLTSMKKMFKQCSNLISINTEGWNTSNVTNMRDMFADCNNLTSLDVSNFDTSKVTDIEGMFYECKSLTSLDVSNWDTSEVTNMKSMFNTCIRLTSLDVSNWNTSNVTDMKSMFCYCSDLTSLDVSNFDTRNVTSMYKMFYKCSDLTSLDLSNFDTNNVTDMGEMFVDTSELSDIGMLYCSQSTINTIASALLTTHTQTIWVKDTKVSDYTATDYVTFKDYKEDNRTLYLNSPLLEGDEIINKEGKLYHCHKMGKIVLNGRESWIGNNSQPNENLHNRYIKIEDAKSPDGKIFSDNLKRTKDMENEGVKIGNYAPTIYVAIDKTKLSEFSNNGFKQWFSENPTTVVYELAEPWYELISDDPLIVQSYAEGKLDTSSIITPTSIQFVPYEEELTYLYASTQYCIQFNSTANCIVDITLGGTKIENKSVSVGLNKIYITTSSELVNNKLIINAKGNATISEVVVVNSNAEFDYFDGLKSSFEDCLVTDVDNENYGKYEVGVKIVGKNKLNGWKNGFIADSTGVSSANTQYCITKYIKVKPGSTYLFQGYSQRIYMYDKNYNYLGYHSVNEGTFAYARMIFKTAYDCYYIRLRYTLKSLVSSSNFNTLEELQMSECQLEEGTTATPYEPYKETNTTIYLNSPLLQGDKIEVVNGKLCHYHKMGMVVLNGSENWSYNGISSANTTLTNFYSDVISKFVKIPNIPSSILNNKFPFSDGLNQIEGIRLGTTANITININIAKLSDKTKLSSWLQNNPITVVYELSKPYYEDITPIQSSFVISTVSEGDMEIITDLPIKSNITYLTNITSAVLMEQQLDELDNGTESLTDILEDEINE